MEFAGTTCVAIATANDLASRRVRIVGGRDWVRLGAVEMGLDCLCRYLQGLPVNERIDFGKLEWRSIRVTRGGNSTASLRVRLRP